MYTSSLEAFLFQASFFHCHVSRFFLGVSDILKDSSHVYFEPERLKDSAQRTIKADPITVLSEHETYSSTHLNPVFMR